MTADRLQRDRRGGSYVLVSANGAPWRHEPRRWELPASQPPKTYEDRARAYLDTLGAYRVWIREQLRATPAFLDPLRGRRLACPCAPEVRCPTTILLEELASFPAETRGGVR